MCVKEVRWGLEWGHFPPPQGDLAAPPATRRRLARMGARVGAWIHVPDGCGQTAGPCAPVTPKPLNPLPLNP